MTQATPQPGFPKSNNELERIQHEWEASTHPNGAEIIHAKDSTVPGWIIVLAKWPKEYIVWNMCEATLELQSGQYFQTKRDALKAFRAAR